MKKIFVLLYFMIIGAPVFTIQAQSKNAQIEIPAVYSNISQDADGKMYLEKDGKKHYEINQPAKYKLSVVKGNPQGTADGIQFDFGDFNGILYYGFIPYGDSRHPLPVYFKRFSNVKEGKASIDVKGELAGRYDMVAWEKTGKGTLGYRLVAKNGSIVYDGKVSFKGTGPFEIDVTIEEGPFVDIVKPDGATISFETNQAVKASVSVGGKTFSDSQAAKHHEITLSGLNPNQTYTYQVNYGDNSQSYAFQTSPKPGSRIPFTFSYASDSRNGQGGGERNVYGANFYIMKRIMALNKFRNIAFAQFSGDLINGYLTDIDEMHLQYANWKRAVEPFAHYFPIYKSMGNHEALMRVFGTGRFRVSVDRFPFDTESAEKAFQDNFVLPSNGPSSEDGAYYDPNPNQDDFPSYRENVYFYTYDNVAVIVLNSNYFYAPSTGEVASSSGNIHAYILDQQLAWLKKTVNNLENDVNIDHVFITQHTPFFPNGGHVGDDMWYRGNNKVRAVVAGKAVKKGIIERRDELLDIVVNQSSKVRAILTGDEHNYAKTQVGPETNIYPEDYPEDKKLKLSRTIYQVNNGAAGAPYYAQEQTPWTPFVSGFTTQNAVVFFHVEGQKLSMEVMNPDTLEPVDSLELKK